MIDYIITTDAKEDKMRKAVFIVIAVIITLATTSVVGISAVGCQQPVEKIIIAEAQQPIAGLVYIAFTKDYFEDEGLDVTLQPHTSGKASLNAVIEGKADLGTVAETPIMHAGLREEKTYMIATIHHSNENTMIVARKDKGISIPNDLKNKKIGVSIGTNGEFFLDSILIMHGISSGEIEYVNLKPEEMFYALVNGEVDAVSTWNPHAIQLQKELGDNGITMYGEGIYRETFNLITMQDFVNNNPEAAKKILRALINAEKFIKESPDESISIIAASIGMDRSQLIELWDIYNFEIALDQSLLVTLEGEARWAIKKKLTDKTEVPNYLDYIYYDALEEVKPEAVGIIR